MDLTSIEKILSEAGIHSCVICGTPFEPYHSRQKTCGSPECKDEYHRRYVKAYQKRQREENAEAVRRYKRLKMREYRAKQKELEKREAQLEDMARRWEKQKQFEEKIAEYGYRYGEVSAQKTLATVPKIDVNLERRRDDNVHNKDSR